MRLVIRTIAATLAVLLGTAFSLAQSDPNVRIPATEAKAKAAAKKSTRKRTTADSKPKASAHKKSAKSKAKGPDKDDADKPAAKSAALDKSTNGSASTASPEVKAGLRDAYAAIPLAERLAIQSDLIWTGDYNGLVDGQFSDRLVDAVSAYQKRQKSKPTGVLNAQERAALSAAVKPRQDEVGWRLVQDPVIGARVGLPTKLVTVVKPGIAGTRWSSAQGQLQIETFRIDTGATLEAVFEQQKTLAKRRTTYSVLKPDFFVASGIQGLKKFYVRAFSSDGEVRGIAILYDQAMEGTMDPMVVAMSNAFVPFANYAIARTNGTPRRKVEYATGFVVNPSGYILTARYPVEACRVIAVPGIGNAERLAEDRDDGLALLRVFGVDGLTPIQLRGAVPEGDSVTLVGIADPQAQGGGSAISTAPARVTAGALAPAPALGFSGAAALDNKGQFVGIAVHRPLLVAGTAEAPTDTLVPVAKVRTFLDAHYVPPAAGGSGVDGAKAAAVRVICVRE